jgi:hypothetical protein
MAQSNYDARDVSISLDGEDIAYLDSFGYDQSKAHELERTLDEGSVWVKGTGEFTGTVVMKAVSDDITNVEALFADDTIFSIVITYAESEPRSTSTFTRCMLMDFGPSDYELDNMPTFEGSWEADEVSHS